MLLFANEHNYIDIIKNYYENVFLKMSYFINILILYLYFIKEIILRGNRYSKAVNERKF
jgi:hypothetical protein